MARRASILPLHSSGRVGCVDLAITLRPKNRLSVTPPYNAKAISQGLKLFRCSPHAFFPDFHPSLS